MEPIEARKDLIEGNIIKDYKIGNTRILISDAYIRTPEENEKAMAELAKKIQPILVNQYLKMAEQGIDISPYVDFL